MVISGEMSHYKKKNVISLVIFFFVFEEIEMKIKKNFGKQNRARKMGKNFRKFDKKNCELNYN